MFREETTNRWIFLRKIFIFCTIAGIIIHWPLLTNRLTTADGTWTNLYHGGYEWEISLGRWAFVLLKNLRLNYVVYNLSIAVGIASVSLAACLVIELFNIKSFWTALVISGLWISFPGIASVLPLYAFSGDYLFALFLSVFCVYIIRKTNKSIPLFISSFIFAFSTGIYQGYVGVTMTLCLFLVINDILSNCNLKDIYSNIRRMFFLGLLGMSEYLLFMKMSFFLLNITPSSYSGVDKIGQHSLLDYIRYAGIAYKQFFSAYFLDSIYNNSAWYRQYFYAILGILSIFCVVLLVIKNKIYKNICSLILLILCFLVLPIFVCIICILAPERGMYCLTCIPLLLPSVFAVILFDKFKKTYALVIPGIFFSIILIWNYSIYNSVSYTCMQLDFNKSYSTAIRLIERIETNPDYTPDKKIMFVGEISTDLYPEPYHYFNLQEQLGEENIATWGVFWSDPGGLQATWNNFISYYCGRTYNICSVDDYYSIIKTQKFLDMPVFPDTECIRLFDDILVIKFSNPAE